MDASEGYCSKLSFLILLSLYFENNMKRIVFSTNNPHKLHEVRHLLKDCCEVASLKDIGFQGEIPETGITFKENASIKSRFIYEKYLLDCFSDDSGLEIDALDGRPGVYSSSYGGIEGDAERNMEKVLAEMQDEENRSARFRTVISLILNGREFFFEGIVEGSILDEKKGQGGFGYDPIFLPNNYSQSFAEMPLELKNQISHRAKAVEKLVEFLTQNL
jgi:XTP/dITP diphosphohydrolase